MICQTPHVISGFLSDGTQVPYLLRCFNQDIPFYCYGVVLFRVCLFSNLLLSLLYGVQKFVTSVPSVSVRKLLLFRNYIDMHCSNIN